MGICILPDGKRCEEWAYYRGECPIKCSTCPQLMPPGPFCKEERLLQDWKMPAAANYSILRSSRVHHRGKDMPWWDSSRKGSTKLRICTCPPEDEEHACTPESRNAQECTMEYRPVCGWFNEKIECIQYPCAITTSNHARMQDANVAYWTEGSALFFPNTTDQYVLDAT